MTRRAVMRRIRAVVGIIGLAIVALLGAGSAFAQGVRTVSYQTSDGNRTAIVSDFGRGRPAPLIVVLHAAMGTSDQVRRYLAWDEIAAREGLVIAYPQSVGSTWNDGRPGDGRRFNPSMRAGDVAFVRRVVDDLMAQGKVDRRRVYVMGLSSGGHMAYRLVCEASDLFAGAAAVIANLSVVWQRNCQGRPIPVLMMNGTADRLSPWDGQGNNADPEGATLSAPESFAFFRARNGCTGVGERPLPEQSTSDNSRVVLLDGTGCRLATQLYRVEGGGHHAPARAGRTTAPMVGAALGQQNNDIEAAEEIWAFFNEKAR